MLKQSVEIARLNLLMLPQRLGTSFITVIGIACVVGVLIGLFSIAAGFQKIMLSNSDEDTVLILRGGARFEGESNLDRNVVSTIENSGYIQRDTNGLLASPEYVWLISVASRDNADDYVNLSIRGVKSAAFRVRSGFKLVQGRLFEPGRFELIVGKSAQQQFAGLNIGDRLRLVQTDWTIVGIFENNGGAAESEVWTDLPVLQSAYNFGNRMQSMRLKLTDKKSLEALEQELNKNPQINVSAQRELDYYRRSAEQMFGWVEYFSYPLLIIMTLGAIFAALNTMYNSVVARTKEIATLRALGFGGFPVSLSVFIESLLLALIGALLGITVIYFSINGYTTNTNLFGASQFAFSFAVTPKLMWQGVGCALAIGFIGAMFPAIRAARMSVVTALREL